MLPFSFHQMRLIFWLMLMLVIPELRAQSITSAQLAITCPQNGLACVLPKDYNKPLFGEYKMTGGQFPREHLLRAPVAVHAPNTPKNKMHSLGLGYYIQAPQPGVVVKRDVATSDKSYGLFDFIHLADLGRPLKAGDTFGWRMRVNVPRLSATERLGVAEVMQVPMKAPIYVRPAGPGSRWHTYFLEEQEPKTPAERTSWQQRLDYSHNEYFTLKTITTPDRGKVKAHLGYDGSPFILPENYIPGNFWTVMSEDPDGDYVSEIWFYNQLIMRIYFPVRQNQ
jgi:hypothetical protein